MYQGYRLIFFEIKLKGGTIRRRPAATPTPIIDLMAARKRSLAEEEPRVARLHEAGRMGTKAA
jgi:hypothetical protein